MAMTSNRLHPDDDFDSPEDAAAFRRGLCPKCEGFGEIYEGDDETASPCTICDGTGYSPEPQCGRTVRPKGRMQTNRRKA